MRSFDDSYFVVMHLQFGRMLAYSRGPGQRQIVSWESLEPAAIGKFVRQIATAMPGVNDYVHLMTGSLLELEPGAELAELREFNERVSAHIHVYSHGGNEARIDLWPPALPTVPQLYRFPRLSSRTEFFRETFLPQGIAENPAVAKKLYLPAPWQDPEMLGQAILNAFRYGAEPYDKKFVSIFRPRKPQGRDRIHRIALEGKTHALPKTNPNGRNYDPIDPQGKSPLMLGAANGHRELAERLLSLGASINLQDEAGYSPLHHASEGGHTAVVELLLESGADVEAIDRDGRSPLHTAAQHGRLEALESLLRAGGNPGLHDTEYENTPLHLAARGNHHQLMQALLQRGAYINALNEAGRTPLHVAAAHGHLEMVQELIAAGADVDYRDHDGETPLFRTVFFQHLECMAHLIDHSASVDARDNWGRTPLHVAAGMNRNLVARLLIGAKANLEARDEEGLTALDLAMVDIHRDAGSYILEHNSEVVEELLVGGASIDPSRIPVQDRHNLWPQFTPSHLTDSTGNLDLNALPELPSRFETALQEKTAISSDFSYTGSNGMALLKDAIRKQMNELLERLLAAGMLQHKAFTDSDTLLNVALSAENDEAVELLVEHGADVNYNPYAIDGPWIRYSNYSYGNSIDIAIGRGNARIVRFLLRSGAEPPLSKEEIGTTWPPFTIRDKEGHWESVRHPLESCPYDAIDDIVEVFNDFGLPLMEEEALDQLRKVRKKQLLDRERRGR